MNTKQNLHTHTTYCDGADTPEQMVQYALDKHFGSIGFSGHSYMSYSPKYGMSPADTQRYRTEISALKRKYADKLGIYLGLEFDMYSDVDLTGYDYIIGSFHYFRFDNEYVGFDRNAEAVQHIIDTYFGGNGMAMAKEYYRRLAELPQYGKIDILGHMDLITKNCEKAFLFDTESEIYRNAAFEAIEALTGKIPFFEVNTGGISRGYRTAPYPSLALLKELRRRDFGAVITSDCHDGTKLDCAFDLARELLFEAGFKQKYILTDNGFQDVAL